MKTSSDRRTFTLGELAALTAAEIVGDGAVVIKDVAPIQSAGNGDITFVANFKYLRFLETTGASAVILDRQTDPLQRPALRHDNPYLVFAQIVDILYPDVPNVKSGIHPTAVIENDAVVDPTAGIGPLCHVRSGSVVGKDCQLVSDVFVGRGAVIGNGCLLYPGVKIMDDCRLGNNVIIHASTVIGSDGFGYAESDTGAKKIKQIGWVELEDDVEIGSNASVDRGALGPTRIGRGTKIDNLVQIAHNVEIGRNCLIVSQAGISGSTRLGNGVILAGQAGIIGHLDLEDGVRVGAQSGVTKSVPPGKTVFGSPARDIMESKRIEAALRRLPELLRRVKELEEKLTK